MTQTKKQKARQVERQKDREQWHIDYKQWAREEYLRTKQRVSQANERDMRRWLEHLAEQKLQAKLLRVSKLSYENQMLYRELTKYKQL